MGSTILEQAVEDISLFADPYTDVKSKVSRDGATVSISRHGRPVEIELRADGRVLVGAKQKRQYPSLNSLLASDLFADISRFAETQLRALGSRPKHPIPTSVSVEQGSLTSDELSDLLFQEVGDHRLRLLLLDGPAGIGKTFQIEELVRIQAKKVVGGIATPPILHVSSRGRRLSNFRDVLAGSTQELGAAFAARQVATLVRRGLLSVAVDGFDELVDADGYEDSWSALRQFVADVQEGGVMVLAARDTFVEEQELLVRIERSSGEVDLSMGQVVPPTTVQAKSWLTSSPNWKPAEVDSDEAEDILREGGYGLRPFFLKELWNAKGWADVASTGPRSFLVNRLMAREASLIAQQLGGVTKDQLLGPLNELLTALAQEMVEREVESIDLDHLAFLTDYAFGDVVDSLSLRKLIHKSGSLAMLELTSDKGARRFPHKEVQSYFLGKAVVDALAAGYAPPVLRRHLLNCEELEVFAEPIQEAGSRGLAAARACSSLLSADMAGDSLGQNLSSLSVVFMSIGLNDRVDFGSAIEATFAGLSPAGAISSTNIVRLDARGSNLTDLSFDRVTVGTFVVDDSFVCGNSLPDVSELEVRSGFTPTVFRSKPQIVEWLQARRIDPGALTDSPNAKLLEKVARRSVRHFYLRVSGDDDDGAALLKDPSWDQVYRVLTKHGRVEVIRAKPMHGRASPLVRVKNPKALLDVSDKETLKILEDLRSA